MKKITSIIGAILVTATSFGQVTITPEWELSDSLGTLPAVIGTSDGTRGMAFGDLGSGERVFLVSRSSTEGNKVQVFNATNGTYVSALDMTGVTGGTFIMNDAGVTEDGVLLMANLASSTFFKVYKWDSEAAAPVNVINWNTGTLRYGDKITVTGNYSTGTARIYMLPNKTLTGHKLQYFEMEEVNNAWQFKSEPTELSTSSLSIAGYPAVDLRPDGGFYLKAGGGNITQYDNAGILTGSASSSAVVPSGSSTIRYIKTVDGYDYLAYMRYSTSTTTYAAEAANRVEIIKVPVATGLADAVRVAAAPSLGKNKNGNGASGLIVKNLIDGTVELYALNTNNGVVKYTVTGIQTTTGVNPAENNKLTISRSGNDLILSGATLATVELFNITGQKVAFNNNSNHLSVDNLKGVFILKAVLQDNSRFTSKISL